MYEAKEAQVNVKNARRTFSFHVQSENNKEEGRDQGEEP